MQIVRDMIQGSDEWLELRAGKITASNFSKVMAKGAGKTRKSYMYQLAAEIITGEPIETYKNAAMEWGNECEPQARAMYELDQNVTVKEVAFVHGPEMVGVSPDGEVGDEGLLEIKCPATTTQIERFLADKFPTTYKAQVQGQLWVCEREWCDFLSFDPRIDGDASYWLTRVVRDDDYITELAKEVEIFKQELLSIVDKLRG